METEFDWWMPHALKKRNRIIVKVKSNYCLKTHKFAINIPNNIKQEIYFDRENGNTLWWDAVCQEMKKIRSAFET